MSEKTFPGWDEISANFMVGMLHSMDKEGKEHLVKCGKCNQAIAEKLRELYDVMLTDNPLAQDKMNEIVLIIGTHMGLDPSKYPYRKKS